MFPHIIWKNISREKHKHTLHMYRHWISYFLIRKALLLSLRYMGMGLCLAVKTTVLNVGNTLRAINVQPRPINFIFNSLLTAFIKCQVIYWTLEINSKTGFCTQVIHSRFKNQFHRVCPTLVNHIPNACWLSEWDKGRKLTDSM